MYKRLLSLALVAGLAVLALVVLPSPKLQIGATNEALEIAVEPKQPQLICPGPVYVNGGETGLKLGNFTQSGVSKIFGRDGENSIALSASGIQTLDGAVAGSKDFNAIQLQNASLKLATGLAVANCQPGQNEAWFVAGDNSIGREALLILVNASKVDASVSLQLIGTNGPIQGTGLSGISAPAGKVTVLPLAAFAPKASTFAVQVSSRGAALGMWLQQKTIRGLTPGGLELVGPTAMAQKSLEIPGLFIRSSAKLLSLAASQPDYVDTKPILRVFATGDEETTFTAQVQGADGTSFGTVIQGTLSAGTVRDFDLGELADGNYVIHIDANQPIMASASYSRIGSAQPDFTWVTAIAPTKLDAGFTAVGAGISKLSIANPGAQAGKFTINGRTVALAGNSNTVVNLTAGTSYRISSNVPMVASQVIDIASTVAVAPVLDYRSVAGVVKVTVR